MCSQIVMTMAWAPQRCSSRKILFHTCELRMKSPMAIYESFRNVGVNEPHKNPKLECRNPKQIRNPQHETGVFRDGALLPIRISNFEFVSDFDIRISDFIP